MRVIIEVDSQEELRETLRLLGDRPVEIHERATASRHQALRQIFQKYQGQLPDGYHFDRDEVHER